MSFGGAAAHYSHHDVCPLPNHGPVLNIVHADSHQKRNHHPVSEHRRVQREFVRHQIRGANIFQQISRLAAGGRSSDRF